jgi:uncharacterized protein YneF (UPF0154 family)
MAKKRNFLILGVSIVTVMLFMLKSIVGGIFSFLTFKIFEKWNKKENNLEK